MNHEFMCRLRRERVQRIEREIPETAILGDPSGDLLFIGWGSTEGVIRSTVEKLRREGRKVSAVHLRYLNPLPPDLFDIMKRFDTVVCPEMNLGQLVRVLRAETLIDVRGINKVQGQPFHEDELHRKAIELLDGHWSGPFVAESLEHLTGDIQSGDESVVYARVH